MWIVEDILKDESCEHKKTETSYVIPTVADAATINDQTNKGIDDFSHVASQFNKANVELPDKKGWPFQQII